MAHGVLVVARPLYFTTEISTNIATIWATKIHANTDNAMLLTAEKNRVTLVLRYVYTQAQWTLGRLTLWQFSVEGINLVININGGTR
jgi:hypothetical protein